MTPTELISESLTFVPGKIVVVSGSDLAMIFNLLLDARESIEANTSYQANVLDARALVKYPSDEVERGIVFEYVAISSPNTIVLVANKFDREADSKHTLAIDVVMDLQNHRPVETIPDSGSKTFVGSRNLFPYISRIYFYDTDENEIAFIKTQTPIR